MNMDSSGSSGALEEDRQQAMSQRIRELENELAALKASAADSERPSTSFGATGGAVPRHTDSVVYVQQDRKMPPFSGRLDAVDALSLDEWIEQMRDFSQTRGRTEKERAQIVYDHLEGAARTEIKYLPSTQRERAECIFAVLREVYGCMHTRLSLQRRFYNRRQLDGESMLDYSHALMELSDQVVKTDAQISVRDLRDQFCDGVRDQTLRIRLRDLVHANPHSTIRDVRGEAIKWMAQYENQPVKSKCNPVLNELSASCESAVSRSSEYSELVSLLKAQQTQLELVVKTLTPNDEPPSRARSFRPRRTIDGKPICYRCNQSGHIARNCRSSIKTENIVPQAQSQKPLETSASLESQTLGEGSGKIINAENCNLIGECLEGEVDFSGIRINCLLDSGSMVTTITESFFKGNFSNLSDKQLKDCGWLGLKAANGLKIPYLGYVEFDITVLGVLLPRLGVLIVEDPSDSYMKQKKAHAPGVLGMNVFNPLYAELCRKYGSDLWESPVLQSASQEWKRTLRYCQMMDAITNSPDPYPIRVQGLQYLKVDPQGK